jgi:hypothetical protein
MCVKTPRSADIQDNLALLFVLPAADDFCYLVARLCLTHSGVVCTVDANGSFKGFAFVPRTGHDGLIRFQNKADARFFFDKRAVRR